MVSKEIVKDIFHYYDGNLYWKNRDCLGFHYAGKLAGSIDKYGYRRTAVNGKQYRIHQLIFLFHHGVWPKRLDHINGDKLDNRIENLRECSRSQNAMNSKKYNSKGSCWKGVQKHFNKWRTRIRKDGKLYIIGNFTSEIDAAKAYNDAAIKYFGEFARLNDLGDL